MSNFIKNPFIPPYKDIFNGLQPIQGPVPSDDPEKDSESNA